MCSKNQTRATLVKDKCSHYCTMPVPPNVPIGEFVHVSAVQTGNFDTEIEMPEFEF